MKESLLVDRIRKALKQAGAKTIKLHGNPFMPAGEPDIICCYRGMFFVFEVKRPEGEPTALQLLRLDEWFKAGACGGVVRSVADALTTLPKEDK